MGVFVRIGTVLAMRTIRGVTVAEIGLLRLQVITPNPAKIIRPIDVKDFLKMI